MVLVGIAFFANLSGKGFGCDVGDWFEAYWPEAYWQPISSQSATRQNATRQSYRKFKFKV